MRRFWRPFFLTLGLLIPFRIVSGAEVGKYAGEFMAVGVGARPLGMGGAYVAIAGDVWAAYWNPAGLTSLAYPEISVMHSERFAGVVNYDYAGVAVPYGPRATLAVSVTRVGVDDIPVTALPNEELRRGEVYQTEDGRWVRNVPYVVRTISDAEWATYLSLAKSAGSWSWGLNAKFVYKGIGDNSAWGLGFDVGARRKLGGNLWFGANLQDATTTVLSWDTGRRELIVPTLRLGLGGQWAARFWDLRVTPALDLETHFEGRDFAAQMNLGPASADVHAGIEVQVRNTFSLRLGSDVGHFTAGVGIYLPRLAIDYAFLSHRYLGDTHRISLRLRLEEPRFARPQ